MSVAAVILAITKNRVEQNDLQQERERLYAVRQSEKAAHSGNLQRLKNAPQGATADTLKRLLDDILMVNRASNQRTTRPLHTPRSMYARFL